MYVSVLYVTLQRAQKRLRLLSCRLSTACTRDLRTCLKQSQQTLHHGWWGCTDIRLSGGSRSSSVTCFDFSLGSSPTLNRCRRSSAFIIQLSGQSAVEIALMRNVLMEFMQPCNQLTIQYVPKFIIFHSSWQHIYIYIYIYILYTEPTERCYVWLVSAFGEITKLL